MANTTWNPSDKTTNASLSGGNLVATIISTGSNEAGRAVLSKASGKYYWEVTFTARGTFGNTSVGVINGTQALSSFATGGFPPYPNGCVLDQSGNLISNHTLINGSAGSWTVGVAVGIALDMTNQRCWIRAGPSSSWNGNATYDPATNVGGVDLSAYIGSAAFPVFSLGGGGDTVTANFGDTAFSGTVPSGFTSGVPVPTSAQATQLALEQWSMPNADAQLTQVGLEEWAAVSSVNTRMIATQLGLEMWASAALAGAGGRATVMIMA